MENLGRGTEDFQCPQSGSRRLKAWHWWILGILLAVLAGWFIVWGLNGWMREWERSMLRGWVS